MSGVKKLREQVGRIPLDDELRAVVFSGIDKLPDDEAEEDARRLAEALNSLPNTVARLRHALSQTARPTPSRGVSAYAVAAPRAAQPHTVTRDMREYEVLFIVRPDVSDDDADALSEWVAGIIRSGGAQTTTLDKWGRRRLAYSIGGYREGIYYIHVVAAPSNLDEVDRRLKNDDRVLRHLIIRTDIEKKRAVKHAPERARFEERQASRRSAERPEDERRQHV
jgi:small subunit ribosomal protein S6